MVHKIEWIAKTYTTISNWSTLSNSFSDKVKFNFLVFGSNNSLKKWIKITQIVQCKCWIIGKSLIGVYIHFTWAAPLIFPDIWQWCLTLLNLTQFSTLWIYFSLFFLCYRENCNTVQQENWFHTSNIFLRF